MTDSTSSTDDTERFALRVQSKRKTIDQWVGISATSADAAHQKFTHKWTGFEVEVRIPHHNGHQWETVFAPNERAAEAAATGRSGEYSDVSGEVRDLDVEVQIVQTVPAPDVETLKQERAIDELSRIQYEVENVA